MNLQVFFLLLATAIKLAVAGGSWDRFGKGHRNSDQLCLTKMRPGNGRGRPVALPTEQSTLTKTMIEYVTTLQAAQLDNVIVTAVPLTAGTTFQLNVDGQPQECTSVSTITANPTQTVYTGNLETAISTPAENSANILAFNRHVGSFGGFRHNFGHAMDISRQRPYRVDCLAHETVTSTYVVTQSTLPTAVALQSSPTPPSFTNCTSTIGSATATTTQHIKCAPTNLVSEVNGHGINSIHGEDTLALGPASDASSCCQLCVETTDCAASEADVLAGNCFLWFTTGVNNTCGLSIIYGDGGQDTAPGSGFILQTGCGSIKADTSS